MANSSYYAKKKEENDRKIAEAMKAREERKSSPAGVSSGNSSSSESSYAARKKETDDQVSTAMAARSERIQSSVADISSEIQRGITVEIDHYNKTQKPAFDSYQDTYNSQRERRTSVSELRSKVEAYRKYLTGIDTDSVLSLLDELERGYDYYLQLSSFKTQDDYDAAVRKYGYRQKYDGKNYDEVQNLLEGMEAGEEKDWLEAYKLESVRYNPDFNSGSGYVSSKADGLWEQMWSQYGMGYNDLTYEYINNQNGIRDEISSKSRSYRADTKDSESTFEENNYNHMTSDEVSIYNYYYSKYGKKKAEEYLEAISGTLEQRANYETVKNVTEFANEHPAISSALSVGTSLGAGIEYIEDVIDYGKDKVLGKPARLGTNEAALMTNTVRGTVSEQVEWEIGNWDAFDFLYGTAMSGADSLAAGTVFGKAGGVVLGLSAAAQGTNDALARGMSDGQAFWNGLFSGVFEALFESISIGNFNKLKEVAPESVKEVIKNLGKSMLINASEETLTELANITYDTMINGEFANYTWGELQNGAWKDAVWQVVEAGASGALMGTGMSGAGNAIGYFNGSRSAKQLYGGSQQELVGEALEINPDNTFAQNMQTKLELGKNLSGGQLNRLVQQNERALTAQDMAAIQAAAENRLAELGETGDVGSIAAALAKQAAGQKLTRAERQAVAGSKYGQRVANELNTDNIRSGEYASAWAEGLDTQRINPQEYSRRLEAAQLPQEAAETTGIQVVSAESKTAQAGTATLEDASKKYGLQAQAMIRTYLEGQDVAKYDKAYQMAYDMGKNGVSLDYAKRSESTAYLTDHQREMAYEAGAAAQNSYDATGDGKTILQKTGETVSIQGIVAINDGQMTLKLTDGRTVNAADVAYASQDDAIVYGTIAEMDMDADAANSLLRMYQDGDISASTYSIGVQQAYRYGKKNYSVKELEKADYASRLTDEQRMIAYKAGQQAADKQVAKAQMAVSQKATVKKSLQVGKDSSATGKVHFDGDRASLTERQSASLTAMEKVAEALGVQIYVFESEVNESGKRVGANGWYDPKDSSIHIDLHAGANGEGTMLFTLAHELTHHIRKWSPAKFKVLADFLMQEYGQKGVSVDALVHEQMAKAERNGRTISYDTAYEEVVADSMETMLSDGKVMEKLAKLKEQDKSLWQKIKDFISELAVKIRAVYEGMSPDSVEGRHVAEMVDAIERLQELFTEGLVDASENYQASEQIGLEIDTETESVSPAIVFSERTWTESDYLQERDKAAKEIAKAIGVSEKEAKAYIDSVNSIAKMIADDRTRLDYFSSPGRSSFVGNVEYGGSFDFSTLCKKRRLLTGTFTAIQKALPNTALTADEILDIRNRMKDAGLEVSCGLCYVEGSRANMGQFAKEFLRLYKQYYPDAWQPNMADVNTPDGIEWVRINHPECYEQYEYFWNHYGTLKAGDKNLFASQQKPKLYQLHTEYKGEILEKFNDDDNVEEKNLNGGIRLQSFSDFEIVHLIDTMQIIMDMSRVGLAGQAYTKVPDFAWALGDTGLKINLSLIAKGVDENGKLIFDDVEGMPIADAIALRDRYSKNVGTILVAFNDEQLLAAMADDRVDYIIPFHRSQWKKSQYAAMGLPAKTKDYTYMQNEKFIKPQYHEYRGRMVQDKATNYMPNEYWDFSKSGKENAEAYLEMCARNNKRPKFYKLIQNNGDGSYSLKTDGSTDGYWKLLIDFKMYDNEGVGSPQMPVKPDFNMDEATRMLNDYSGGHSNFPVAQGIVDDFVKEYKDSHNGVKFSDRNNAPTFYSHMAKVVEGVKQEKLGAASVVSMLRGKSVKAEEIKWSGIEAWLDGKKSVTKAELQEFIAGSMLQIEEETLDYKERPYTEDQKKRLAEYEAKRDEIVKRLANEWKRITGEEFPIQNAGADIESAVSRKIIELNLENKNASFEGRLLEKLRKDFRKICEDNDDFGFDSWRDALRSVYRHRKDFINYYEMSANEKAVIVKLCNALDAYNELQSRISEEDTNRLRAIARETDPWNRKIMEVKHEYNEEAAKYMPKWGGRRYNLKGGENYREVLFRIPDSTYTNEAMFTHWDDKHGILAHARIQDFNTFIGKMLFVEELQSDWHNEGHKTGYQDVPDAPFRDNYHEYVMKRMIRMAAEEDYDSIGWTPAQVQVERWSKEFAEGYRIEYDQDIPKFMNKYGKKWGTRVGKTVLDNGTEVWSMAITDSMKESVLNEGQPLYSMRDTAERAKEYFGTTTDFEEAGFILPSGEMLKFTDDKHRGERQYDHRAIGIAYGVNVDLNVNHGFNTESNKYLDDFVEKGGIRFDPGSFDLDMDAGMQLSKSIPLTAAQEQTIREFIAWKQQREEMYKHDDDDFSLYGGPLALHIEFGADANYAVSVSAKDLDAWGVKHLSYEGGQINASRIIADIRHYYRTGETRKQSTVAQFLYSDRDTESVSNRSLLANAFEGVAQNDIERQKIQEYKGKISLIESEERKLQDLNQQIKDLSFSKGPKDTKAIRDLQFEAKQTANRISTYDKQLLRLEASKPLQDVLSREKKMAYKRAEKKGKEALEAYREKTMKTQRELIDKWKESRKKGVEGRHKTAMRHKIKDVVNELNQYLLRGTKDRHVPIELQKAVAEALDAVNMDTVGADERIAKLEAELLKAKTPEQIQEISRKIDHIREMGDKMNTRLKKLKDAYDQFVNSDDPMVANSHDEVISNKLQAVIESVGDTPLRDMTLAQLEDVYDMYRMVLTTIRNTNKAFKAKKSESISIIAGQVMMEVEKAGGKQKLSRKGTEGIKSFFWNNLKPVYAFEHIGSDHFTEVFNNVRAGEDVWALDVTEAREFYLDKSKKHGYDSWDFKKRYKFTSSSGMDFELNLEQIMSLYAYSKRDQAADHLKRGGIVIDETTEITVKNKLGIPVKFNPTEATAYNISDATLAEIISKLTADQKDFVDVMQDYLSTVMGAKGNEVSLEMYGVKLFKEKFYFPLKSAQQFMAKAKEQQKGEVKIKNSGFSKETVQKASNPIVLTPFMNVWADHVNEMSMYHAFVLPMEDFYRVYNYKTPTSDTMATESVEMFIQNAYGKGATKYIDQLLKDLNGGARTDNTTGFINKMMGLFKKGAVFASLSVVVQQPSAIARAVALVDTKYFIGPKVDHKRHKALWDEVKQYAPVAIIKEMGYFDTNMGKSTQDFILGKEYSGFKDKMKALFADSDYRDEVLSKAPALADEIAWCGIWEAVKRETKAKNPGMDIKSEAFLQKCGERFTEVIVKTQVYDSVLSRSGNMRSKDTGMKMATAFMAEPTTSINMIADALLQGKRGNRKYARGAIGAVVASQILNSILVSFVYAGRDDEEDETYWEKYIGTLAGQTLDSLNPAGYIPFIKDIMSIVQGYDVERSDMAVISDLWKAWENLKKDTVSPYRKVEGFAGSIAQIFGLPVKNIMRDARGIYQTIDSFMNGQQTTKAGIGYAVKGAITGKAASNDQQLYEAILSGDQTQIARVKGRYEDQTAINNAIRKALRANDPRIHDAAVAWNANDLDEYMRIAKAIIAEKNFVQDDVVSAIRSEANALSPDDGTTSTSKAKGLFTAEKFAEAIAQGDQATANAVKIDIIQTAQKNGKTAEEAEKSFASTAKGELKELYLAGSLSESKTINALTAYCGETQENAEKRVEEWAFEGEYGFTWSDRGDAYKRGAISAQELKNILVNVGGKTWEEATWQVKVYDWQKEGFDIDSNQKSVVEDYETYCEPAGIQKNTYFDAYQFYSDAGEEGVAYSKTIECMPYINSLPLTANQKTALAQCWWAASTVNKYKLW